MKNTTEQLQQEESVKVNQTGTTKFSARIINNNNNNNNNNCEQISKQTNVKTDLKNRLIISAELQQCLDKKIFTKQKLKSRKIRLATNPSNEEQRTLLPSDSNIQTKLFQSTVKVCQRKLKSKSNKSTSKQEENDENILQDEQCNNNEFRLNNKNSGYITCSVCNQTKYYSHVQRRYGIFSCEPCFKFFSRFVKDPKHFQCNDNGQCIIVIDNNNNNNECTNDNDNAQRLTSASTRCKACWLKLCIEKFKINLDTRQLLMEKYYPSILMPNEQTMKSNNRFNNLKHRPDTTSNNDNNNSKWNDNNVEKKIHKYTNVQQIQNNVPWNDKFTGKKPAESLLKNKSSIQIKKCKNSVKNFSLNKNKIIINKDRSMKYSAQQPATSKNVRSYSNNLNENQQSSICNTNNNNNNLNIPNPVSPLLDYCSSIEQPNKNSGIDSLEHQPIGSNIYSDNVQSRNNINHHHEHNNKLAQRPNVQQYFNLSIGSINDDNDNNDDKNSKISGNNNNSNECIILNQDLYTNKQNININQCDLATGINHGHSIDACLTRETSLIDEHLALNDSKANHFRTSNKNTNGNNNNNNNNNNLNIKKSRCKECDGCRAQDCGQCTYCLDKKKFGGSNVIKQACKYRVCVKFRGSIRRNTNGTELNLAMPCHIDCSNEMNNNNNNNNPSPNTNLVSLNNGTNGELNYFFPTPSPHGSPNSIITQASNQSTNKNYSSSMLSMSHQLSYLPTPSPSPQSAQQPPQSPQIIPPNPNQHYQHSVLINEMANNNNNNNTKPLTRELFPENPVFNCDKNMAEFEHYKQMMNCYNLSNGGIDCNCYKTTSNYYSNQFYTPNYVKSQNNIQLDNNYDTSFHYGINGNNYHSELCSVNNNYNQNINHSNFKLDNSPNNIMSIVNGCSNNYPDVDNFPTSTVEQQRDNNWNYYSTIGYPFAKDSYENFNSNLEHSNYMYNNHNNYHSQESCSPNYEFYHHHHHHSYNNCYF